METCAPTANTPADEHLQWESKGPVALRMDAVEGCRRPAEGLESFVKALVSVALIVLTACGVDRTGWGRGRLVVVREGPALQVRRSTIRVEEPTKDVVMSWIGVRMPRGAKPLAEALVTVFDDRDGDGNPQPTEVLLQRTCQAQTDKILFSDVRLHASQVHDGVDVLVTVRRQDGHVLTERFPFRPD